MSAIPPNIIGSVLQSGVAQQAQSQARDRAENERTDASREMTGRGGKEDILEIEETDARTQVNAEGGGGGSQGREDSPPDEEEAATESAETPAVTHDEDGRPHLDVSA